MKWNRSSMLYGTVVLTFTSIVSQIVGFCYRIFLSRLIGAEVMGLYQLIMPVYSVIMSLTAVGLTVSVSNLSSQYHALGNRKAIRQILRRCLGTFLVLFTLVATVTVLFYDPISVYLLGDARTQAGLFILLPCILLTGIENLHKHYFYGTGNVRPAAFTELAEQFIRIGMVLGLLILFLPQNPEWTVALIVLGMCGSEIFSAITQTLLFRRHMGRASSLPGAGESPRVLNRKIFAIAAPITATSLLGNLMASANAVLIPQRLVAAGMDVSTAMSSFGVIFGMTMPMLYLPTAFIGALMLVLVPKLAESCALGRMDQARGRIHKSLLATSVLTMPAMALLVVLGPTVGVYLFKDPRVGNFILPLSVGVVFSCYESILGGTLNGIGKQSAAARISLLCGALQLACTYVLMGIPGMGLTGFVIGFIASTVLGVLLKWFEVRRATKVKLQLFQWGTAPALSALLMGLVVNLLFRFLMYNGVDGVISCLACLLFGMVLYLAALSAQGVRPVELFRLH